MSWRPHPQPQHRRFTLSTRAAPSTSHQLAPNSTLPKSRVGSLCWRCAVGDAASNQQRGARNVPSKDRGTSQYFWPEGSFHFSSSQANKRTTFPSERKRRCDHYSCNAGRPNKHFGKGCEEGTELQHLPSLQLQLWMLPKLVLQSQELLATRAVHATNSSSFLPLRLAWSSRTAWRKKSDGGASWLLSTRVVFKWLN